jgi:hypothetical protein
MPPWLKQVAVWLPRIISVLMTLAGMFKAVPAAQAMATAAASPEGAFSGPEWTELLQTLLGGLNLTGGGVLMGVLSFALPPVFSKISDWRKSRGSMPLADFAATQVSLGTLRLTFEGRPADMAHIDALSDSSVEILKLATNPPKPPVVVPGGV